MTDSNIVVEAANLLLAWLLAESTGQQEEAEIAEQQWRAFPADIQDKSKIALKIEVDELERRLKAL